MRLNPSTLLSPPSSIGINDIPSVDTWNGKPGAALPPSHSSAGKGASGSIAGLPYKPSNTRSASAYGCCVAAPRRTPCRFGVIVDHLQPRPTKPLTLRSSVTPSVTVVCRYHDGRGPDDTIVLVVARVEGIGLVLQIMEGGRCVCLFVFGQHRLWQLLIYLELGTPLILRPILAPTRLPQLSNTPTAIISSGAIVFSCLVSEVLIHLDRALLLPLRSGRRK